MASAWPSSLLRRRRADAWLKARAARRKCLGERRNTTMLSRFQARPHSAEEITKPTMERDQEAAPAEPRGEIAGERHHHGGGDEIRGEHPGDLIRGGAEGAEQCGIATLTMVMSSTSRTAVSTTATTRGIDRRLVFAMRRLGRERQFRLEIGLLAAAVSGRASAALFPRLSPARFCFCRFRPVVSIVTEVLAPTLSGLSARRVGDRDAARGSAASPSPSCRSHSPAAARRSSRRSPS